MAKGKFALGAVFGAAAGFVTGVLLAPKSGKSTRDDVKEAALKVKDTIIEDAEKVKDTASKTVEGVRHTAETVVEDVNEKVDELKGRAKKALEAAKEDPATASKAVPTQVTKKKK